MATLITHKPAGMTLATLLKTFRNRYRDYKHQRITYAGRLDPMAQGLMILLSGEDVHRKDELLGQNKSYEVEVIFGLSTDTYDALGLITDTNPEKPDAKKLTQAITKIRNKKTQVYPPYSSKTVNGTPLFSLAKSGQLKDTDRPEKDIEIYDLAAGSIKTVPSNTIYRYALGAIGTVEGDFRQEEIIQSWQTWKEAAPTEVHKLTISVSASSGTYMRGLAHELGEMLGTGAIALKINRTKIGDLTAKDITHPIL